VEEGRFKLDDFELYQVAREFRKKAYKLLRQLPPKEKYALGQQMRKAAVSVTNNIAEGHGRWHYQENIRFCQISRGSIEELIDDFNTCDDEAYGDHLFVEALKTEAYELIRRVNGYIAYLRKSKQGEYHTTTHHPPHHHAYCRGTGSIWPRKIISSSSLMMIRGVTMSIRLWASRP